jgi:lipopolysaccharide/colanic/teichoic acid biosynthesis glycosyltransferase
VKYVVRVLVQLCAFSFPIFIGFYHSEQHFGSWNPEIRYSPLWLVAYGLTFMAFAFVFGVPALVERPRQALIASLLAAAAPLAAASIFFVVHDPLIPRLVVVGTPVFLFAVYVVLSLVHALLWRRSKDTDRVVFVVEADAHPDLETDLSRQPERKFTPLSTLDPEVVAEDPNGLAVAVSTSRANLVVLSETSQLHESVVAQAARLHERGVRVRTLTTFYDEWLGKFPLNQLERTSLWFDIRDVHELQYTRLKRLMDVVVASIMAPFLILSVPIVAVFNAVRDRGPLFFKQQRVGQHGVPFTIWKFRTMTLNEDVNGAGEWTVDKDPRITGLGRVLRRSHIDELPQVLNVFAGHLSIVGPRPEQVGYVEELTEKIPFYRLRHVVKPGITGWAQVKYPYGASELDALEKLQYELYYLKHQSPSLDVRVCMRTVRSIVTGNGK